MDNTSTRVIIDKVEGGDPALFQRPQREEDRCGKCGRLLKMIDGRLKCPNSRCDFWPWFEHGVTVRF